MSESTTEEAQVVTGQSEVPVEAEAVETGVQKPRAPTKLELKRHQQYMERRKRLLGRGVPEERVDQVIAEEDFRAMPTEKKLERFVMSVNQAFGKFAQDVMALQHNSNVLADAMDINFKAMARCLAKAGVSLDDQSSIIREVEVEIAAERKARMEAQQKEAQEKQAEAIKAQEASVAEEELKKAEGKPTLSPETTEPAPIPEGATTFGG